MEGEKVSVPRETQAESLKMSKILGKTDEQEPDIGLGSQPAVIDNQLVRKEHYTQPKRWKVKENIEFNYFDRLEGRLLKTES